MEVAINQNTYGIRMIDTHEGRSSASLLINKMYAWRGYPGTHRLDDDPNRITLTATEKDGEPVGTLSLGIDSPIGLLADQVYRAELDSYRARGRKICEITKLAFDPRVQSKEALASLFHLSVIYARDLHQCTDIFIEVAVRHRRFYEHMLGFKQVGAIVHNPRVDIKGMLLAAVPNGPTCARSIRCSFRPRKSRALLNAYWSFTDILVVFPICILRIQP